MATIIADTFELVRGCDAAITARGIGAAFHHALLPFGVKATYARAYDLRRADAPEWALARISPPGWEEVYAREKLAENNALAMRARYASGPYTWLQAIGDSERSRLLRSLLTDWGFPDGLAVPCHGAHGYLGLVSLAFERLAALSPAERTAIELAAVIVHDRMRALADPQTSPNPLSPRERDCIAFVAEGKSDWEISQILGIAHATVRDHIENARRKLGARTRAQATARAVAMYLI